MVWVRDGYHKEGYRRDLQHHQFLTIIFHACVMKRENEERRKNAEKEKLQLGIQWIWKPGFSLPPKSQSKAM